MKTIIQAPLFFCDGAPVVAHLAIRDYPQIHCLGMDIAALVRIESGPHTITDPLYSRTLYLSTRTDDPRYVVPVTIAKVSIIQNIVRTPVQLIALNDIDFYKQGKPYSDLISDGPCIDHAFIFLGQLLLQFVAEPQIWILGSSDTSLDTPPEWVTSDRYMSRFILNFEKNPIKHTLDHLIKT